ncbi:MAG: tRNA(His) guanylyltransferase Thg1 family protein [Candidatus Woesearchaeota archaeon]
MPQSTSRVKGVEKPWKALGFPKPKSEASSGKLSLIDYEVYSGIELPGTAFFVRLDGWAFHSVSKSLRFTKPFDKRFLEALIETTKELFQKFNPTLAYIFSDEINLLFLKPVNFRRIEKIDSIFAAVASSKLTNELARLFKKKKVVAFDCRCIPLVSRNKKSKRGLILKYLRWRQAECFRNHNNAWAQKVLFRAGLSPRSVSRKLSGMKTAELEKLCKKHGIDLSKTPAWQRWGILLYKQPFLKVGYNPIKKRRVRVVRHKIVVDTSPKTFMSSEGKRLIEKLIKER